MAELEATIGMGIKLWAYNLNVIQILTANYTLLNCEAAYNTNIGSIILSHFDRTQQSDFIEFPTSHNRITL